MNWLDWMQGHGDVPVYLRCIAVELRASGAAFHRLGRMDAYAMAGVSLGMLAAANENRFNERPERA